MKHDDFKMPFGKHKGETFRQVPMEYLDWLVGWMEETKSKRDPNKLMMEEFGSLYRAAVEYLEANKFGADEAVL